jgi:hypothetical protein
MTTFGHSPLARRSLALTLLAAAGCGDYGTSPGSYGPPPTTTVDVVYCGVTAPTWLAFQDDADGAWTQAQPTIAGDRVRFSHTFTGDRGAVAAARVISAGQTSLAIEYGQPAELATVGDVNPSHCGSTEGRTLTGTVTGFGGGALEVAAVNAGFGPRDVVQSNGASDFSLPALIPGPQEILATRSTIAADGSSTLAGVILRRTPELPNGATIAPLDFASGEAFAPATPKLTVEGLGGEELTTLVRLLTAHGNSQLALLPSADPTASQHIYAIPEAHLEAGDLQLVVATARPVGGGRIRAASRYFRAPTDQALTLGGPAAAPTLSVVATTPALRPRALFTVQPAYDRLTSMAYQQASTVVSVSMTPGYAALIGGYDLVVPDLSAVAGFDPQWALRPGTPASWTATRIGGTLGLGFDAVPTEGATTRMGIVFDTFTP